MRPSLLPLVGPALCLALLPSCIATIFRGTTEDVLIDGDPPGGVAYVRGEQVELPALINVSRAGDGVWLEHPEYGKRRVHVPSNPAWGWIIGGLVITPIIGFIFDMASGGLADLEDHVIVDFRTWKVRAAE